MWHRHPARDWTEKALPIRGWNEALPVFVLGAGAPLHPLPPAVYHQSWATAPAFRNGREYHGITLPLGPDWGGPLFLSQYPFLGLDPRGPARRLRRLWRAGAGARAGEPRPLPRQSARLGGLLLPIAGA